MSELYFYMTVNNHDGGTKVIGMSIGTILQSDTPPLPRPLPLDGAELTPHVGTVSVIWSGFGGTPEPEFPDDR